MVVDDDRDFCFLVDGMLSREGYRVISVHDGRAALERLNDKKPALILLDYRLPGRSGMDILGDLKNLDPAVPIIMITAYADVETAVKAIKIGAFDYVAKPVNENRLLLTIKRALEKQCLEHKIKQLDRILNERRGLFELMGRSDGVALTVCPHCRHLPCCSM